MLVEIEIGILFIVGSVLLVVGASLGAWLSWRVTRGVLEAANTSRYRNISNENTRY